MQIHINSYVKEDSNGSYVSGQVYFHTIVTNAEWNKFPDAADIKVNLSKSGNPNCDTSLFHLQGHNSHAGTFTSKSLMRLYVDRVKADIVNLIGQYNINLEDAQSTEPQLEYPITHDNDELHPSGMEQPAMMVVNLGEMMQMMGYDVIDEEDLFAEDDE